MRRIMSVVLTGLLLAPGLAAQEAPSAASVTLFSNGRTLVRRDLPVQVPVGSSTHEFTLGLFDPSSLMVLDPGVRVDQVRYDPAFDESALLRRNVGELFRISQGTDKPILHARLLGVDPERWEVTATEPATGIRGILFGRPGTLLWSADQLPAGPVADVTLTADRARSSLPVMYETMGGNWSASYRVFLGSDSRVEGVASVSAGALDLADAAVQLLAGDIGMKAGAPMPRPEMLMARAASYDAVASNEAVGEVRLYTLPGRTTFVPGVMTAVPLFAPVEVEPELRLSIGGALSYRGGVGQMPDEVEVPVEVRYRFDRERDTPFGETALPAGSVSVYDRDSAGRMQLVGSGAIGHTAAGEPVEVSTGSAFDVTARRTQTSYSSSVTPDPRRTIATIGYRVVVRNAKEEAVQVEVREDRAGEWSVVNSSVAPVRRSSSRVVFPLTVPARGEATLTYQLRVVW